MGMLLDYSLPPGRRPLKQLCLKEGETYRSITGYPFSRLVSMSKSSPLRFFYRRAGGIKIPPPSGGTDPSGFSHEMILGYSRAERYAERIDSYARDGKSVLVVVPDKMSGEYLQSRLNRGDHYHSGLKASERDRIWQSCLNGEAVAVIGGLSAGFLPIGNLGGVIIDRSGSPKYRGMMPPYINARMVAKRRSEIFYVPLVEGYSTFPLDTVEKRSSITVSDSRPSKEVPVSVHRIGQKEPGIPEPLIEWAKERVGNNHRVLLLLNRKESSRLYYCPGCKGFTGCPVCGILLQEKDSGRAVCRRCGYERETPEACLKCRKPLEKISDIALDSVIEACRNRVVEKGILSVSSAEIKDHKKVMDDIRNSLVVVATPVILNPVFRDLFQAVAYVRPESMFAMESFDAAEKIFAVVSELKEMVCTGGRIDVFSTFHFHYAMKYLEDEEGFFERELKYRKWFQLPPHNLIYTFEVKGPDVRDLGKRMREIHGRWRDTLGIQRLYISSRKKVRGSVRGILIAHTLPEKVRESGILQTPKLQIKRCAG
jgi:primosomal protein N'